MQPGDRGCVHWARQRLSQPQTGFLLVPGANAMLLPRPVMCACPGRLAVQASTRSVRCRLPRADARPARAGGQARVPRDAAAPEDFRITCLPLELLPKVGGAVFPLRFDVADARKCQTILHSVRSKISALAALGRPHRKYAFRLAGHLNLGPMVQLDFGHTWVRPLAVLHPERRGPSRAAA